MPNVYGYARVSTPHQRDKGYSLQDQQERLPGIAAARYPKHTYTKTFVDAQSAHWLAPSKRRECGAMIHGLEPGDAVVCVAFDRACRNVYDQLCLDRLFKRLQVSAYCDRTRAYIGDVKVSADDRMMMTINAALAERESSHRSSRILDVQYSMTKRGLWPWRFPPRGWMVNSDRRIVPDLAVRERARWVKELMTLNCWTLDVAARYCEKQGIHFYKNRTTRDVIWDAVKALEAGWPLPPAWEMGPDGWAVLKQEANELEGVGVSNQRD